MKLGEAMVKNGLITNDILARALERQIIFGGRLGTNLIEMGAVTEELLARFLGKSMGVPYAGPEYFEDVVQDVLDAFPAALASKYIAFPIKKERNRIHLAMKDPNDMAAVDEIRFITGSDVKAYIASEVRIVFALEKYYGIKRDLRYVSVLDGYGTGRGALPPADVKKPGSVPETAPAPPISPMPGGAVDQYEYLGDESQVELYTNALENHAEAEAPAPPPPLKPVEQPQLYDLYRGFANPKNRDYVAGIIMSTARMSLSRVMLLLLKDNVLTGWMMSGMGGGDEVKRLKIILDGHDVFSGPIQEKRPCKVPVTIIQSNAVLLQLLGGRPPAEAVVFPLIVKGRVVAALYGDNGAGSSINGDLAWLSVLMEKAALSLEILILKARILKT